MDFFRVSSVSVGSLVVAVGFRFIVVGFDSTYLTKPRGDLKDEYVRLIEISSPSESNDEASSVS